MGAQRSNYTQILCWYAHLFSVCLVWRCTAANARFWYQKRFRRFLSCLAKSKREPKERDFLLKREYSWSYKLKLLRQLNVIMQFHFLWQTNFPKLPMVSLTFPYNCKPIFFTSTKWPLWWWFTLSSNFLLKSYFSVSCCRSVNLTFSLLLG
jgi:hypothetical protein